MGQLSLGQLMALLTRMPDYKYILHTNEYIYIYIYICVHIDIYTYMYVHLWQGLLMAMPVDGDAGWMAAPAYGDAV
jgi:hypothetical protein